ncbi:MAG: choice-of-anchor D domain-containing protein [Lewinellaceae bacterium]|nr:choice-of-anchor D domain-containing protein [Lewinellaceae bacterium]
MNSATLSAPARLLPLFFLVVLLSANTLRSQDVILQGFYWNTHPGDVANTTTGGLWWDTIAGIAPQLAAAGFKTVWTPPANKGFAGIYDMGYGVYDYFDYGQFNQNGTTRTRHGNSAQFQTMMDALHGQGLKVMADVVLNHRAGASETQAEECDHNGDNFREQRFTKFRPGSNRILMDSTDFHPTSIHCDLFAPYHDRIFFEDICYFNLLDQVFDPMLPDNGWYFGPHNLGKAGDSLIVWGRNLLDPVNGPGFDEIRLDAVKHVEPGFLAPFLVELFDGQQPFAVGELFDGDLGTLAGYRNQVEGFVSNFGAGSKDANLAIFDFNLRYALRDMCNNGAGGFNMWNLNSAGLRFGSGMPGEDVVTFVENHDVDRIGYVATDCADPDVAVTYGATCLKFTIDSGHDPVLQDKDDLGYPYIMAAEGRPTVFWKDWFWYGLDDAVAWQMNLRNATAAGASTPIASLGPVFTAGNGGDLFVLNRNGEGSKPGLVLALNDNPAATSSAWVNTPFPDKYLKDYSDGYLFQYTQAFGDSRAQVKAQPRDYAWWAPTGLYPAAPGMSSHFQMDATPGGCPHFVTLRVADAANLLVNANPIATGDEVAVKNNNGDVVGIGRIGQDFAWDGVHDMLIEVLGVPSANGMANGEQLHFVVWDQSAGAEVEMGTVQYAAVNNNFSFSPRRPATPNRNGNFSTFNIPATAQGLFTCGGISRVLAFGPVAVGGNVDFCGNTSGANAAVYSNGLQSGDNDGAGFQSWTSVQAPNSPSGSGIFTGTSTDNGNTDNNNDGDINTNGVSWCFYANSGNTSEATRPFQSALPVGGTVSIRMDNGFVTDDNTVGFSLRNAANANVWEFYFEGGTGSFQINDKNGPYFTAIGFTDEGLQIQFKLLTATTYQATVTTLENGNTATFSGEINNEAVDRIRLFNANAGPNTERNTCFNSLSLCFPPALVINETDYDQPGGADDAEFVELKNVSAAPVDLSAYKLQLLNAAGTPYQTVQLSGTLAAGGYHVVCGNGSGVPNCNQAFAAAADQMDDGPAAVRLLFQEEITADSVFYEGAGVTPGDNDQTPGIGLSRVPNGADSNQNSDWQLTCSTPGTSNTTENTDTDGDGVPDACDPCPLADENNVAGFNPPTCACLQGKYAVYTGSVITGCTNCPPGKFCPDGLNAYPCPVNTAQNLSGAQACNNCPFGTHAAEGSTSCDPNTPPSIALSGNNMAIANRSDAGNAGNDTDFGSATQSTPVTHTFTVENLFGSNPLVLNGVPVVTVAGIHQSDFSVTQPIAAVLPGGSITTFTVTFTPSAAGLRSALIVLTHNDLPENPFVFSVEGSGGF